MIGDRTQQPQNMLAGACFEAIEQHGISRSSRSDSSSGLSRTKSPFFEYAIPRQPA